ncbi:glycosyl hydrolase [Aspergillus carlsbadensis]|nr:glycosyl hydrolase [Aspergillus carlsbadensis]
MKFSLPTAATATATALLAGMLASSQVASAAPPTPSSKTYTELYRPQFHYSAAKNWLNDPNGLVYHDGVYHLYYQHNPGGTTWGAMSWGHASSRDLTRWTEHPVALQARGFPDNITEMFFSGTVVVDERNTSGFGKRGKVPWVAMYTSYYPVEQTLPSGKHVRKDQQAQSIAYSLDKGMTWTTYDAANPVIAEPPAQYADQVLEFRDPGVFWHDESSQWIAIVSLAKLHKVLIYTSHNLKDWTVASEFGPVNAVGGVWECPSIFPLSLDGGDELKWILMLGLNPGGPPGTVGSGSQYIVGNFNGTTFTADEDSIYTPDDSDPDSQIANWLDYGPDFYAALGFNGLPREQRTIIAWMNNWQYANIIPTDPWRSAMSSPRHLALKTIAGKARLVSEPAARLKTFGGRTFSFRRVEGERGLGRLGKALEIELEFSRKASGAAEGEFGIAVAATKDFAQETRVGYDFSTGRVFVDRSRSGDVSFDGTFASTYYAPLALGADGRVSLRILLDWSSVEVFGGDGEATITSQIFPAKDAAYSRLFSTGGETGNVKVRVKEVRSAWR